MKYLLLSIKILVLCFVFSSCRIDDQKQKCGEEAVAGLLLHKADTTAVVSAAIFEDGNNHDLTNFNLDLMSISINTHKPAS